MLRTRAWFAGLLAVLSLPACAQRPAPEASAGAPSPTTATAAMAGGAPKAVAAALPFIENDAPRALAEAKKRGVPLFVEAWAPW
jgi:hypothetical protein